MAIEIKGFTTDYYLTGFSTRTSDDGKERYSLHFLFKNEKINGLGTFTASCEKGKLEMMLGGKPVIGKVYKVYTDKFVSKEGKLITYLKDMYVSYELPAEK